MSNELIPLAQVADIIGGYAFKSGDFGSTGFPVVKIANIEPPRVNLADGERIPAGKVVGLDKFRLNDRDIVMAMTGATIGKVGRVRSSEPSYVNQRVAKLSAKAGRKFDDFIFALVTQAGFDAEVINNSNGSAQANISTDGIGRILVPDFSPDEQLQIGRIVSALDDKIELNRRMNETLEALAQSLFKSWFVDATQSALPKGWREATLGEVAENASNTFDFSKVSDVVFVNTGDVLCGDFLHSNLISKIGLPGQAKKAIRKDDILFSEIRPGNRRYAYVDFDPVGYVVSTKFMVIRASEKIEPRILYQVLTSAEALQEFQIEAESRSGTFPQITFDSISRFKIILPPIEFQRKFASQVAPLDKRIKANKEESRTLAALRDALLPKLLSGELRVSAAAGNMEARA
jgi:type I restriction enzyme S subunit